MMHEASSLTLSFAMPPTLGFGFGARHLHSVLALRTLIVKVAGSILGLEVRCVCVCLLRLYLLRVVPHIATPDIGDSGTGARKLTGEECSRQG